MPSAKIYNYIPNQCSHYLQKIAVKCVRCQWECMLGYQTKQLYYRDHLTDTSIFINVYSPHIFGNQHFLNTLWSNRSTYFHAWFLVQYKVRQVGSSSKYIVLKLETMQIYQNTESSPTTFKILLSHNISDLKTSR